MRHLSLFLFMLLGSCAWLSGEQPKKTPSAVPPPPAEMQPQEGLIEMQTDPQDSTIITVVVRVPYSYQQAQERALGYCLKRHGALPLYRYAEATTFGQRYHFHCSGQAVAKYRETIRAQEQFEKENPYMAKWLKEHKK